MRHRRRLSLLFLLLVLVLPIAAEAVESDRSDKSVSEAENLLRKGNYRGALAVYGAIAERSPSPEDRALAHLRMADIYHIYIGNTDTALQYYSIILLKFSGSPYSADALYSSGIIFYEKKKYPEALKNFRQFIKMDPSGERVISAKIMIDYCLTEAARPAEIRVLVLNNISEVIAKSPGKIECLDQTYNNERYIVDIPPGKSARFFTKGLYLRGSSLGEARMKAILLVSRNNIINVNGNNYRGRIKITVNGQKQLDVINTLDIENYIKGVVPREMGRKWAHEALKAQAVVSRTYALYQIEKNSREAFDICSTTNTQVYGGMDAESESSNRAVDETHGVILLSGERPALVYYHANSAGHTEDALNVWSNDIPYLRGRDDGFSLRAAELDWSCSFSLEAIRSMLGRKNLAVGKISDIEVTEKSKSGRVKNMLIRHGNGKEMNLSGNQFRTMIDPSLIKSALFIIKKNGKTIRLEGKGAGHGVGMSQWGAFVMAREGFSYRDILKFYFPELNLR